MLQKINPTLLILAAGIGTRYRGVKQIAGFGPNKECIIDYSLYDAIKVGFKKIVFVVRDEIIEEVKDLFEPKLSGKVQTHYVCQKTDQPAALIRAGSQREKPWGTAHAILAAQGLINEPFCVINADDYYGPEAFVSIYKYLTGTLHAGDYSMVGYPLVNTLSSHGKVSRGICKVDDAGYLSQIIERTQVSRKESGEITFQEATKEHLLPPNAIASMNFWGFLPDIFGHLYHKFGIFAQQQPVGSSAEFFIPSPVQELIASKKAKVKVLKSPSNWFGVTYPADKTGVENAFKTLIRQGVYPINLWESPI